MARLLLEKLNFTAGKTTLGELNKLSQVIEQASAAINGLTEEQKALLAEKKEISFWNIPKAKELNAKIAELTEDIEELKSENAVLLNQLDCADDAGIAAIKKDIAYAEAGLFKLEQQEEKYSSKLEAALSEYADLKEQGADFEPAQLYAHRMALRPEKSVFASNRIQFAYGEKYDPQVMFDSERDVAELLLENAENRTSQRELEQKKQQKHKTTQKQKNRRSEQEQ